MTVPTSVPMLDVNRTYPALREEILLAIARVAESGRFLHGPDVAQLEASIAQLSGVEHAVACASGSDALLLALMALEIGPGDEVIVPSFTFFATASAVWRLGARAVFADIDPQTFNLCPRAVSACLTSATRAIIPVHLFGQAAEMTALSKLAQARGIDLIEDAAQAIGAAHADRPVGAWGELACFSFYPTKNLGGFGDGGLVTARSRTLADRVRLLAAHGMNPRYYHSVVGINSRLDTLQAAVLNVKLRHLAAWTAERRRNATRYIELLRDAGLERRVAMPAESPGGFHVWNQFTIRVPDGRRDALRTHLASRGVGTEIYYPLPLHLQECFRDLGYGPGSLPHTEQAAQEVLSLPIFPGLTSAEQELVVQGIAGFYQAARVAA